jgi:hypothetical protein
VGFVSGGGIGETDGEALGLGLSVGEGVGVCPIPFPDTFALPPPAEKANVARATAASNTIDKQMRPGVKNRLNDVNFISSLPDLLSSFLAGSISMI